MKQQSHATLDAGAGTMRGHSPFSIVLLLLVFVLAVVFGIYETIPLKQRKAPEPDPTAQAIHENQTSLQQALDQLKAIQQTVLSDQADTKRLSGLVNALSVKLEALQQSFASAPQAPMAIGTIEPESVRPKRGSR